MHDTPPAETHGSEQSTAGRSLGPDKDRDVCRREKVPMRNMDMHPGLLTREEKAPFVQRGKKGAFVSEQVVSQPISPPPSW
jgi:hypothetical protein